MFNNFIFRIKQIICNNKGQGMVEYALIIAGVAILLIGALTLLKDEISSVFSTITDALWYIFSGMQLISKKI